MRTLLYHLLISAAVVVLAGGVERAIVSHSSAGLLPLSGVHGSSVASNTGTGSCAMTAGLTNKDVPSEHAMYSGVTISPDSCVQCHEDEVASFRSTTHARSWRAGQACENCHGDASKHLASGGAAGTITTMKNRSASEVAATCLKCHEKTGEQSHARLSEHARAGVSCVSCHDLHPTKEHADKMHEVGKSAMLKGTQTELCLSCHDGVSADFNKPTHHRVKEGVIQCTSCHNPHGTDQPHQLRADTKTLCVKCHADKRGPFVYEHDAMGINGCLACHDSHGSGARNMLKARDPRTLCISCHSREIGAGVPHGRANFSMPETGDCTRCHAQIHGSNRTEYFFN